VAREAALEIAGRGVFVQVNTEDNPQVAARFGVRGVPAFFALKHGKAVATIAGALPKDRLVRWFLQAVA